MKLWCAMSNILVRSGVCDVSKPKESISIAFFKYGEWKPSINCFTLTSNVWTLTAQWTSSEFCTAWHHAKLSEWSSDVSCQIKCPCISHTDLLFWTLWSTYLQNVCLFLWHRPMLWLEELLDESVCWITFHGFTSRYRIVV